MLLLLFKLASEAFMNMQL